MDFANLRAKIAANRTAPAPGPKTAAPAARPAARPAAAAPARPAPTPAARAFAPAPAAPRRPLANVARPAARPVAAAQARAAAPAAPRQSVFGGAARPAARGAPQQRGSIFAGIGQARDLVDANYDRDGNYFSRIDSIRLKPTRKSGTCLFIEKTHVVIIDDGNGTGHKLGETSSHCISSVGGQAEYFLPTVRQFIAAVTGGNPDEIDETDCEAIVGDDQPFAGMVVEWAGRTINTDKVDEHGNPKTFTKIKYKRAVPASELLQLLDERQVDAFFPGGVLQAQAEQEGAAVEGYEAPEQVAEQAPEQTADGVENAIYDDGAGGFCTDDGQGGYVACDENGNQVA